MCSVIAHYFSEAVNKTENLITLNESFSCTKIGKELIIDVENYNLLCPSNITKLKF